MQMQRKLRLVLLQIKEKGKPAPKRIRPSLRNTLDGKLKQHGLHSARSSDQARSYQLQFQSHVAMSHPEELRIIYDAIYPFHHHLFQVELQIQGREF